ncbi:MAG: GNAT family N-acetyltransferase [Ruminococcus sp.]|nr:GNAT family N-acetyltransferase [Ruminococcus sp.]
MNIKYRMANLNDIDDVYYLINSAIKHMEEQRIFQWDNIYPAKDNIKEDIENNSLFIGLCNGQIVVSYTINKDFDSEYKNGNWKYENSDFRIIHRLCVNPSFQNQGIAYSTLLHIESELKKLNIESIRLDVFSENPFALRLYSNIGYKKVGIANWRKGLFFLMEKHL